MSFIAKRTEAGLNRARDDAANSVSEMGVGTGATAPTETDTELEAEVVRKEKSRSIAREIGVVEHRLRLLVTEANGEDLTEIGIWDTDGNLVARVVFPVISKTEANELVLKVRDKWRAPS